MTEYLTFPEGDTWQVTWSRLAVLDGQPHGVATKAVIDPPGRITAERYGDGVKTQAALLVRFDPATDAGIVHPFRFPSFSEMLEAADRLFPTGWICQWPLARVGDFGVGKRPGPSAKAGPVSNSITLIANPQPEDPRGRILRA